MANSLKQLFNISKNNKDINSRIVIAHILEDPEYYRHLKKMEARREKYWSTRNKPNIFLE